jgi:hypothetical protein
MRTATSSSEPSTVSLIAEVREVRESLSALKRKTMKDGISLEIENQGGEVYVSSPSPPIPNQNIY